MDNYDAMEAYKTFRWARSWFFWITVLSLLTVLGIFATVTLGVLDQQISPETATADTMDSTVEVTAETTATSSEFDRTQLEEVLQVALSICNNLIYFCVILFCVMLLVGTNFAIIGQLGGLAPLARSFVYSILLVVFILPWHQWQSGQAVGVLFSFAELMSAYEAYEANGAGLDATTIRYYVRFALLPAVALILLIMSFAASAGAWKKVKHRRQARQNADAGSNDSQLVSETMDTDQDSVGTLPLS